MPRGPRLLRKLSTRSAVASSRFENSHGVGLRDTSGVLDEGRLRTALAGASADAGLDPSSLVVYLVEAVRPSGTTPLAYLHPEGVVAPGTVAVFQAVAGRAAEDRLTAHRLALWSELPGIPEAALEPMLRHELEHARRWERSGPRFFEADELLRAAVRADGGRGYSVLPSELEANAASSRYAERTLSPAERAVLAGSPDCVALVADAEPPGDVVADTLAELERRADWSPWLDAAARRGYLAALREACGAWNASAVELTAGRAEAEIVTIAL